MNKKYFTLYYIGSLLTYSLVIIALIYQLLASNKIGVIYNFSDYLDRYVLVDVLAVISFTLFIIISLFLINKKTFNIDKLIFPISYLVFFVFIVIISLLFNNKAVVKNMHFTYYYGFLIFDHILLNIYTLMSLKKK